MIERSSNVIVYRDLNVIFSSIFSVEKNIHSFLNSPRHFVLSMQTWHEFVCVCTCVCVLVYVARRPSQDFQFLAKI